MALGLIILCRTLPGAVVWQVASVSRLRSGFDPWPRRIIVAGATIAVFQPQLDRWSGNQLEAHAAAVIKKQGSDDNAYGVIWFDARTEVDKVRRVVTLEDFKVTKYNFPSLVNNGSQYLAAFRAPPSKQTVPLDLFC
jgi:hypothetical protein